MGSRYTAQYATSQNADPFAGNIFRNISITTSLYESIEIPRLWWRVDQGEGVSFYMVCQSDISNSSTRRSARKLFFGDNLITREFFPF